MFVSDKFALPFIRTAARHDDPVLARRVNF